MRLSLLITIILFGTKIGIAQSHDSLQNVQQDTTKLVEVQDTVVKQTQDSIEVKETRAERRARKKEEKEREKLYYKGILKDSARLEIERVSRIGWKRSVFVPGWGQYTNGGLWWIKVPIIYGGFVTSYLVLDYWQWYYKKFLNEIAYRMENNGDRRDPDLIFFDSMDGMIRQKDYARRNRDLTVLATVGWYGLNIVEAYVNSMLKNRWSLGEEVAIQVRPTFMQEMPFAYTEYNFKHMFTPGFKLTLSLK